MPYPVDKFVKVDRHVPVPINRYYKVDRPYEVVRYVQKPYIVKVQRKVHVPIVAKEIVAPHHVHSTVHIQNGW